MNIFTAFFRIVGGIMIFVYITILKIVKKREEYEREERIMALENSGNIFGQTVVLNNRGNYGIQNDMNTQLTINDYDKNKLTFGTNGLRIKNNSQRKNTNSLIESYDTTLNDRLISDDRIKQSLYNRVILILFFNFRNNLFLFNFLF